MGTLLCSVALQGVEAVEVEVEVNARASENPRTVIVGLPDAVVRESGERVHSAVSASALHKQNGVHIINLAPADLRKEGPSFALPIALAMAACGEQVEVPELSRSCVVGEFALDGKVRPVKGTLSIALEAKNPHGFLRPLVELKRDREAAGHCLRSRPAKCKLLLRNLGGGGCFLRRNGADRPPGIAIVPRS